MIATRKPFQMQLMIGFFIHNNLALIGSLVIFTLTPADLCYDKLTVGKECAPRFSRCLAGKERLRDEPKEHL